MNRQMTNGSQRGNRLARSAMIAVSALLSVAAIAQQSLAPGARSLEIEEAPVRVYSVELIIFEYADSALTGGETFQPDQPPPVEDDFFADQLRDLRSDPDLTTDTQTGSRNEPPIATDLAGDDSFVLLPVIPSEPVTLDEILTHEKSNLTVIAPEDYILDDVYARLERLDAYRPLMRAAWSQKTIGKEDTLPINLRQLGNPPLRLDGTVTLYLSRFLHLDLQLSLEDRPPQRVPAGNNRIRRYGDERQGFDFDSGFFTPSTFYRIDEDRIVKNGELRYYDHPRFGVIAKITRVEEEQDHDDPLLFGAPLTGSN